MASASNIPLRGLVRANHSIAIVLSKSPKSKETPARERPVRHVLGCECPVCTKYTSPKMYA